MSKAQDLLSAMKKPTTSVSIKEAAKFLDADAIEALFQQAYRDNLYKMKEAASKLAKTPMFDDIADVYDWESEVPEGISSDENYGYSFSLLPKDQYDDENFPTLYVRHGLYLDKGSLSPWFSVSISREFKGGTNNIRYVDDIKFPF